MSQTESTLPVGTSEQSEQSQQALAAYVQQIAKLVEGLSPEQEQHAYDLYRLQ